MQIAFDSVWLMAYLLAFARAMGFVLVGFPFAMAVVPRTAQVAFAVALALGTEPLARASLPVDTIQLIVALGGQLVIGAMLGYLALAFVSVGQSAGSLVGLFGGFYTPPSLDPLNLVETPVTGGLYNMVWVVLFFVSGADVAVIHGYAATFALGVLTHLTLSGRIVIEAVTITFVSALEVASPILAVMFFSQIVVAILTKVAPQLYALTFIFPLQILLSLIMMIASVTLLPHMFDVSMRDLLAGERDLLGG
jgi:flagellar biosynthetic protein FliR